MQQPSLKDGGRKRPLRPLLEQRADVEDLMAYELRAALLVVTWLSYGSRLLLPGLAQSCQGAGFEEDEPSRALEMRWERRSAETAEGRGDGAWGAQPWAGVSPLRFLVLTIHSVRLGKTFPFLASSTNWTRGTLPSFPALTFPKTLKGKLEEAVGLPS